MAKSADVIDAPSQSDVLRRIDDTIEKLDQMRDELRTIREWAEMMQRAAAGGGTDD